MYAARYQVVPRAFGCAASQDRSLDVQKVLLRKVVPHDLHDATAKGHCLLNFWTTQIEKPVFQTQVFTWHVRLTWGKGGRLRLIEHYQLRCSQLDLPCPQLVIPRSLRPQRHPTRRQNDVFAAAPRRQFDQGSSPLRGRHDLALSIAIPQVNKHRSAVIASAIDPTTQRDLLINILCTQFATCVSSKQGLVPVGLRTSLRGPVRSF